MRTQEYGRQSPAFLDKQILPLSPVCRRAGFFRQDTDASVVLMN
jgi:hypothetical protein